MILRRKLFCSSIFTLRVLVTGMVGTPRKTKFAKLWTVIAIGGLGVAVAFTLINALNESAASSGEQFLYLLLTGIPLAFSERRSEQCRECLKRFPFYCDS